MWVIVVLFAVAVVWSVFGEIDIVAVAPGQIIVSDRTKLIQPLEAGVVKVIRVKDGDHVTAGQVLIELDPTTTDADRRSVDEQWRAARTEVARASLLMEALRSGVRPDGSRLDRQAALLMESEWADMQARLSKLNAEVARREAEQITARQLLAKLQTTLPLAQQREDDIRKLAAQGFMSSHAGQDRTRERIELERDLQTQQARVSEANAALHESRSARLAWLAETTRTLADKREQASLRET